MGNYKTLTRPPFAKAGDNLAAHHIPNKKYMKSKGIAKEEGISINVEHPYQEAGGRHREIHKKLRTIDPEIAPRGALAKSVLRAREVYIKDGVYTQEVKKSLRDVIEQNKAAFPDLFKK